MTKRLTGEQRKLKLEMTSLSPESWNQPTGLLLSPHLMNDFPDSVVGRSLACYLGTLKRLVIDLLNYADESPSPHLRVLLEKQKATQLQDWRTDGPGVPAK